MLNETVFQFVKNDAAAAELGRKESFASMSTTKTTSKITQVVSNAW